MLQLLWNQIAYSGISFASNVYEQKHILLVNMLALFLPFFTLLNLFSPIFFHTDPLIIYAGLSFMFLLPFTIVWNASGRIFFARIYLVLLSFTYILFISIANGNQVRGHFFFLTEALVVYFIFPQSEKKWMHGIIALLFITFSVLDVFHENMQPYFVLPPERIAIVRIFTDITFGILVLFFAFYIYSTFQRSEKYIQFEHDKSEKLLQNILPLSIIKKLRENPDTIAERFENCTVLFSDIVGFTEMSKKMPATAVVTLLNEIFSHFDDLAEKFNLEKIKTIGDAYMVVGGLPEPEPLHAELVAGFALEMLDVIREYRSKNNIPLELRIGINSGDAVAGVIGKKKFIYDLWGDSVNTASRMESHGIPGQIQVSESTYQLLKSKFKFEDRGSVEVKGLGKVRSFLLLAKL